MAEVVRLSKVVVVLQLGFSEIVKS